MSKWVRQPPTQSYEWVISRKHKLEGEGDPVFIEFKFGPDAKEIYEMQEKRDLEEEGWEPVEGSKVFTHKRVTCTGSVTCTEYKLTPEMKAALTISDEAWRGFTRACERAYLKPWHIRLKSWITQKTRAMWAHLTRTTLKSGPVSSELPHAVTSCDSKSESTTKE